MDSESLKDLILSCLIRIILLMRAAYLVEWSILASPLFLLASASMCNCYLSFDFVFHLLSPVQLFLTSWAHVCVCVCVCVTCSVVSNSLQPHGLYSLPGSFVQGIHQARILEWVAISSSRGSSQLKDQTCIDRWILYHWITREAPGHLCRKHLKVP